LPEEDNPTAALIQAIFRARIEAQKAAVAPGAAKGGYVARFPPALIVPKLFILIIDRIDPEVPAMGRPATVYFTLSNYSKDSSSGKVSGDLGGSATIHDLGFGASVSGSFSFTPTTSGTMTVVVTYIEDGAPYVGDFLEVSAQDQIDIDVVTGYILEIADGFRNPSDDLQQTGRAAAVCQNRTFDDINSILTDSPSPTNEWEPVLGQSDELGSNVGISGWVCEINLKTPDDPTKDVPFTHPFYNDWTFYLASDPQFNNLLSPGNTIFQDPASMGQPDDTEPCGRAYPYATQHQIVPPTVNGDPAFIEFEMEQGLVTREYWPDCGDRVAALGRWIVDCAHANYSTEIHPPLILAKAAPAGDATRVKMIGRAFLTSQWFDGRSLFQHLWDQVKDREAKAAAAQLLPPTVAAIPGFDARARVLSPPFSGIQSVMFTVRPPTPRASPEDTLLLSYHFTVRTGVYVAAFQGKHPDEVDVLVIMNEAAYVPFPLARIPSHDVVITIDELIAAAGDGAQAIKDKIHSFIIATNPWFEVILAKGIEMTRYDMPPPGSPKDTDNVVRDQRVSSEMHPPSQPYAVDDDQPYPIYGWLTLAWRRHLHAKRLPRPAAEEAATVPTTSPVRSRPKLRG
jgi:hypothetical protein